MKLEAKPQLSLAIRASEQKAIMMLILDFIELVSLFLTPQNTSTIHFHDRVTQL